ncbi:MAG: hypothetical protein JW759_02470 [Candidatus Coatesbacteria bacterium]|nr:hypothetical protein [Candidatus Coatesbacteria bacterium]
MARKTRDRALFAGFLILAAGCLAGCAPRSHVSCEPNYHSDAALDMTSSRTALAVLPFQAERGVPESFARLSQELLTGLLSQESLPVIGSAELLSEWETAEGRPWRVPQGREDFQRLRGVLNADVAVLGTVTRYVYGQMNPTEIAFSIAVVDLASGRRIASFDASGLSRRSLAYSGLSKPPQSPESLAPAVMSSVRRSVVKVLKGTGKSPTRGALDGQD